MNKPIIKAWDVSQPATWSGPENPTDFCELFLFGIGPDEEFPGGLEWFDVEVVTPAWLARQVAAGSVAIFGRDMLVVDHWDPDLVVRTMQSACDVIPEGEWSVVVEYLSRYSSYEYDGYRLPVDGWRRGEAAQDHGPVIGPHEATK